MQRLFPAKPTSQPAIVTRYMAAHPEAFDSETAVARYLKLIVCPPSRRWRYQLNGKSGNTYALNLLFEIEYGCPFTAALDQAGSGNLHPDFALFQLVSAGLLSTLSKLGDPIEEIDAFPGLSLATVRNPWTRIVSAFFYLCRSHEVGDRRFLPERIRLNALCQFDWEKDTNTVRGFEKFVDYIDIVARDLGPDALDAHWLPQALHIRPDLYRPDIIGRTEALDRFAEEVQDALDVEQRVPVSRLRTNRRPGHGIDVAEFVSSSRVQEIVRRIYAEDFGRFGYSENIP